MSLGKVHARILIVGAWLLGTATATGGSLWAISHLGQGILGPSSQQLTVAAVNRALASETSEPATPPAGRPPAPVPESATPFPSARPRPASSPSPSGTLLTSSGGNVVAGCAAAGAYLLSWSPQQGYEANAVVRGPAAAAKVTFQSGQTAVTMVVTCHAGVPAATTSVKGWHGDD